MSDTQAVPAETIHRPYIPAGAYMPEFTFRAVLAGAVLGIIFGASSLYLVLKVGITVSASIPVAVLSITLFRALSRTGLFGRTTILENNIVQTTGSAGESIAFGVGVTMPAMMMLGFDMEPKRVMVVSLLGGLLGILMMIPLRRAFIVKLHGKPGQPGTLLYPEGTACAQVLISGETGGTSGATVFAGFGLAFLHKIITEGFGLLRLTVEYPLKVINRAAEVTCALQTELLGVGYIIGLRTAATMMAGGVLGYLVIAPTIYMFGENMTTPLRPANVLIRDMSITQLRSHYILYIGAGCVTAAGIISMIRTLPLIVRSVAGGLASLSGRGVAGATVGAPNRHERDMPMSAVVLGLIGLVALLAVFLSSDVGITGAITGALLVVLFGFLFVTVSSRLTGEIGSSSNPISGMTVATLSLTCLIFLSLGWTGPTEKILALSIGAVVCIAASNGGTTSQDLKTGFLVGATPRAQQWAIMIGALTSALVIGLTLMMFNNNGTVFTARNLPRVDLSEQVASLQQTESYEGATYRVWRPNARDYPDVPPGKYLVSEAGQVSYLVDPAITGTLDRRDDGSKVDMKFEAPKTQVIALLINGVLDRNLNWGLVLMGAMIAITLELCGISSLAFAVGVYIPMSDTAPIFLGGLARWAVDSHMARRRNAARTVSAPVSAASAAEDEVRHIAETESSPGVLMASGYIAGGTLAGVTLAFCAFSPGLRSWMDRSATIGETLLDSNGFVLAIFALLMASLMWVGTRRRDPCATG